MNNNIKTIKNKQLSQGKSYGGTVVSIRNPKTVVVSVKHIFKHPLYRKGIWRAKHFAVHNESFTVKPGDQVRIVEVKPISKTKHFMLAEVLRSG